MKVRHLFVRFSSGVAAATLVACLFAPSFARAASCATEGTCVGFPRVALVADASDGLTLPRRVLEVSPGRFRRIDMGSWETRRGRLLQFDGAGRMLVVVDDRNRSLLILVRGPAAGAPAATIR